MGRTAILFGTTLAIMVVLFTIYQLVTSPEPDEQIAAAPAEHQEFYQSQDAQEASDGTAEVQDGAQTTQPAQPPQAEPITISGVVVPEGDKPFMTIYDEQSGRARLQFRAKTWEPTGRSGTEFRLEQPEIRLLMPSGQVAQVRGEQGHVVLQRGERGNYDPKRGRLEGNVRIFVDRRRSGKDDIDVSADDINQPLLNDLVRIWLDDVSFDLDLARLSSDGPMLLQMAEAQIKGTGLTLKWNELDNVIEYLEIKKGKSMEVVYDSDPFLIAMPGTTEGTSSTAPEGPLGAPFGGQERVVDVEPSSAAPQEPDEQFAAGEAERASEDGTPEEDEDVYILDLTKAGRKKTPRTDTYTVLFEDDVVVERRVGIKTVSRLAAKNLQLLFDVTPNQRAWAQQRQKEQDAEQKEDADPDKPKAFAPKSKLHLTWSGPMLLKSLGSRDLLVEKPRLQVKAWGESVDAKDRQGTVHCAKLVYHDETGRIWLHGSDDDPVRLTSGTTRQLIGRKIMFDQSANVARFEGPGRMQDMMEVGGAFGSADETADQDERFSVSWERGVELTIDTYQTTNDEGQTVERDYLKQAQFHGGVKMVQGDDRLQADEIALDFGLPRKAGAFADNVERLNANKNVLMVHGKDEIRCRTLEVEMTVDDRGKIVPSVARSFGRVIARQESRHIEASDHMIVNFASIYTDPEPLDPAHVRAVALARGIDPGQIDLEELEARRKPKMRLGLSRLQAFGNVRVTDPAQGLDVVAEELDATFAHGQQLDTLLVTAIGDIPARVRLGDYLIEGVPKIDIDASRHYAHVPGAGRLDFASDQDLDGRDLDEPVLVSIRWANRMHLAGDENVADFDGSVVASSRNTKVTCARLHIDFEDTTPRQVDVKLDDSKPWGIFTPLVRQAVKGRQKESQILATRFDKRPKYLLADGNAVALSTEADPETGVLEGRLRIAGPQIGVDVAKQYLVIEGAGNLLIEDYALPKKAGGQRAQPFGDLGSSGPSQTFLEWEKQMAYRYGAKVAEFDGAVHMVHRSGSEMIMAEDLAEAMNIDVETAREMKGRHATLTCQNLLIEFVGGDSSEGAPTRGYQLNRFKAAGRVYLEETGRAVTGARLSFDQQADLISVYGDETAPARIFDQDEKTGRFLMWRGPELHWEISTNRVEAPRATIVHSR